MRAILLRHRTALINHQTRGLLGERGPAISRSPEALMRAIPELLRTSADELTSFCQTLLIELLQHQGAIEDRVHLIEASIQSFMKKSTLCKKIAEVPGTGPITSTAIVAAVGDARQSPNGRHDPRFPVGQCDRRAVMPASSHQLLKPDALSVSFLSVLCLPGWGSCPDSIRLAASLAGTASADAATPTCGPCSFMALGPFCAMRDGAARDVHARRWPALRDAESQRFRSCVRPRPGRSAHRE